MKLTRPACGYRPSRHRNRPRRRPPPAPRRRPPHTPHRRRRPPHQLRCTPHPRLRLQRVLRTPRPRLRCTPLRPLRLRPQRLSNSRSIRRCDLVVCRRYALPIKPGGAEGEPRPDIRTAALRPAHLNGASSAAGQKATPAAPAPRTIVPTPLGPAPSRPAAPPAPDPAGTQGGGGPPGKVRRPLPRTEPRVFGGAPAVREVVPAPQPGKAPPRFPPEATRHQGHENAWADSLLSETPDATTF